MHLNLRVDGIDLTSSFIQIIIYSTYLPDWLREVANKLYYSLLILWLTLLGRLRKIPVNPGHEKSWNQPFSYKILLYCSRNLNLLMDMGQPFIIKLFNRIEMASNLKWYTMPLWQKSELTYDTRSKDESILTLSSLNILVFLKNIKIFSPALCSIRFIFYRE